MTSAFSLIILEYRAALYIINRIMASCQKILMQMVREKFKVFNIEQIMTINKLERIKRRNGMRVFHSCNVWNEMPGA